MTSSFFGIETMRRALLTHRSAMDVIGHNVANASTPGYTRQQVILTATPPFSFPGTNNLFSPGQIGTGVMVKEVRRIRDVFVDNQIRTGNSQKGEVEIEKETLRRIENAFLEPASSEGFNDALTKFYEAWQELSKRPENMAVRYNVANTAKNLVDVFHSVDQELRDIREDLNSQLQKDVDEINRITGEIVELNKEISKVFTSGNTPNDLMDKRDLLLDELSEFVDISVNETDTHGVSVHIGGRLLLQDQFRNLMTDEMAWDHPSQNSEPGFFRDVSQQDFFMLSNFARGELKGLTVSRDEITTGVQGKFTEMVQSFMNEINNAHIKGFGIDLVEDNILSGVNTTTIIMPAAAPLNVVTLNTANNINVGDILRFEEPIGLASGENAITVRVERKVNNDVYFEMIDPLTRPDDAAAYAVTPYTIAAGASVRKIVPQNFNFFDLQTALQPQFSGDTSPEFTSRMTSSLILPTSVTLNTTMKELESLYGVNIAYAVVPTSLQLDENATTQGLTEGTTLRQAFDFIIRENLKDNDGKPLDIVLDQVNRRIVLSGITANALDALGGDSGSANPLLRLLGFEGQGITGESLPLGTNLSTTLQDLGISTGWFMIDNTKIAVTAADQTQSLQAFLDKINNTIFNQAGSNTEQTNVFFDPVERRMKIVSDHQFSTLTNIVPGAVPAVVGNSNFLTAFGLQRDTTFTQDSTSQNKASVTSSDAGIRIKVSDDIMSHVEKIASAAYYAGIPGDNSVALAIAQLKNMNVLSDTADGIVSNPTETSDEFYNNMISKLGTDSQKAITDNEVVDKFLEFYNTRRQEVSGVSIDEEMTKMLESQRSFQAAARMLNVVDEMLELVINGMGLVGR